MAIRISGTTGIDMGGSSVSNASQIELQEEQVTPFSGFKNYIINGNFDIWQYKDVGLTYPQTSNGYGTDDRWYNSNVGSTKTHSQVVCTDTERALFNASYFSRTVVTSVANPSNYCVKMQYIENVTRLAGKTVTISFWAKADSNKNIAIELMQNFGTGGTPTANIDGLSSQLISLTTTWQKKTITIVLPSIVGKTIGTDGPHTASTQINFWLEAGSSFNSRTANLGQQSGTFDIAQIQLEEGSVATPFENRPYGLELSLCQRYYERILFNFGGNVPTTNGYVAGGSQYSVTKRVIPTLNYGTIVQNDNIISLRSDAQILGYRIWGQCVANSQVTFVAYGYASAEL